MNFINKKGQNIFEYSLLFVIVVAVLIAFLSPKGKLSTQVNQSFDKAVKFIDHELNND